MLDEKERTRKIREFNDGIVFEKEIIKKKRDVKGMAVVEMDDNG